MRTFILYTELSIFFIIIIIPLAYFLSRYYYKKDTSLTEITRSLKNFLNFLRFFVLSIILILLLGIFIKYTTFQYTKPLLIIAYDNSESISLTKNFKQQNFFIKNSSNKFDELAKKYDVVKLKFGNNVSKDDSLTYSEKITNISNLFNFIAKNYNKDNIASVVLISDFIYNAGENPLYNQNILTTHSVLIGDTTILPDIAINKILYNKIVYTGTIFKIQAKIKSQKITGKTVEVRLINNNKVIDKQLVKITGNNFFHNINFFCEAKKSGIEKFTIVIDTLPEEINKKNNIANITIEIKSERHKVFILSNIISPDIGCFKTSIENAYQYVIKTTTFDTPIDTLVTANCVIIFLSETQKINISKIIETLNKNEVPVLFVYGKNTNNEQINKFLNTELVKTKLNKYEDAYCEINSTNNILNFSDEDVNTLKSFPPLSVLFGEYTLPPQSEIIAFQKIKQVVTTRPLLAVTNVNKQKIGILFGEGLYRWRLAEYRMKHQHTVFNKFINKIISYLCAQKKKKQFLVKTESIYSSYQPITIEAELYTLNNEPVNTPEVLLEIKDSLNNIYNFTFQKTSLFYSLTIGSLSPGKYKWKATTNFENKILHDEGEFYVKEESLEANELTANKDLAYKISQKTGGKYYHIEKIDELIEELKNLNYPGKMYNFTEFIPIINFKFIFFLLILLLSLEWALRRYYGSL